MYYNNNDEYLAHYGVLGMKWGQHRASKKGTDYTYTSLSTKAHRSKAASATKKYEKTGKDKYKDKADLQNRRAKRSATHDKKMQDFAESRSTDEHLHDIVAVGGPSRYKAIISMKMSDISPDTVQAGKIALNIASDGRMMAAIDKSIYIQRGEKKTK